MNPDRGRVATVALLTAIVALAAVLRFYNLSSRGLIYWDEAKFALEGIRYQEGLRFLVGAPSHPFAGKGVGTAKPGHALLIGLSYLILGVHDYAGLYLDAACSLLAIPVIYAIGRRLFSDRAGVIAAVLLAVSAYDIVYARSDLSESDAALVFLIAVWVWTRGLWSSRPPSEENLLWRTGASALLCGAAFSINYRASVYIAVLIALDLILAWHRAGLTRAVAGLVSWCSGLAAVLVAWEVVGLLARGAGVYLFRNELTGAPSTYFQEVAYQLHEGKQSVIHFQPLVYIQWFAARETVAAALVVLLALVLTLFRRDRASVSVAALWLVPYCVYVFAPFYVPRNLVMALPFIFLLVGAGTDQVLDLAGRRAMAIACVGIAILAVFDAGVSWKLSAMRSGFALAGRYVAEHGGRALTASEIIVFYVNPAGGGCTSPALPLSLRGLRGQVAHGYRLAILERHHQSSVSAYIERHDRRVARFLALGTPDLPDDLIASENSSPPPGYSGAEFVDVYRLSLHGPIPATYHPSGCNRDLVI